MLSMTFLPKNMQFQPMNNLYEEGKNPWGVLHYEDKTVIVCGSKYEYNKTIIDGCKLPKAIVIYIQSLLPNINLLKAREYPENSINSIDIHLSSIKNSNINYDYTYDI